jgi:hypothetical protein
MKKQHIFKIELPVSYKEIERRPTLMAILKRELMVVHQPLD